MCVIFISLSSDLGSFSKAANYKVTAISGIKKPLAYLRAQRFFVSEQ